VIDGDTSMRQGGGEAYGSGMLVNGKRERRPAYANSPTKRAAMDEKIMAGELCYRKDLRLRRLVKTGYAGVDDALLWTRRFVGGDICVYMRSWRGSVRRRDANSKTR